MTTAAAAAARLRRQVPVFAARAQSLLPCGDLLNYPYKLLYTLHAPLSILRGEISVPSSARLVRRGALDGPESRTRPCLARSHAPTVTITAWATRGPLPQIYGNVIYFRKSEIVTPSLLAGRARGPRKAATG